MIKQLLFTYLFISLAIADSYVLSQKCSCEQLLNLSDCIAQGCQWLGRCQSISSDSNLQTISDRCSSIDRLDIFCPITLGCAFWQNKCVIFPGCEYFPLKNNKDCQKISAQCTSDGITCIDPLPCSEYSPDRCAESVSSSGTGFCKLDAYGKCVDQTCENGQYDNDFECNQYLEGCLTNGQWCVSQRKPCNSYTKDCEKFIGSDGRCSNKCIARTCSEYQMIATTNQICSNYQYGCISSGYGCVQAPLPSCTSYNYTDLTCYQLIGNEGRCDSQESKCVPRQCQYAKYNNNQQCEQYKSGCISNGVQCVDSLNLCSQYLGTTQTCSLITGFDGKCIGTSDEISYCKLLDCSTADQTFNTDDKCSQYQKGCVTTGKGCIQSNLRLPCEANSKQLQCTTIQGSNGKCYDDPNNINSCSRMPCSLGLFTDNEKCSLYQNGCVSNGTSCVDITQCVATRSQSACKGTNGCTYTNVCVQNLACSQFIYQNTCLKAGGKDCIWANNACRDLQCSDYTGTQQQCAQITVNGVQCYNILNALPTQSCTNILCSYDITSTTDQACNAFLKGCVTTGKGCIEVTASCRNFSGTTEQCLLYRNQTCAGSGVCSERQCSDNTSLQTDQDCNAFLAGCVTKFPGCIESTVPCEKYPGTSEAYCLRFKSNGKFCNWTGGPYCATRLCSQQLTATSNFDCNNFLAGCLTNGKGCYDPTVPCNQYLGNQLQCVQFTGNLQQCARRVQCIAKTCSDTIQASTQQDCISYLSTCRFNGQQCINSQTQCNQYSGMSNNSCQNITTTSGGKCWGTTTCADRQCSDNTSATSQDDCNQFLQGCLFTGTKCVVKQSLCSNYINFTQAACNAAVDLSGNKCTLLTATGTCKVRECSDVTTNCSTYLSSCVFTGTSCQIQQTACNLYTSFTQEACNNVADSHGNKCWMESAGSVACSSRSCSDTVLGASTITCQQHKQSCQFNGTICVDQKATCDLYQSFTSSACQTAITIAGDKCTNNQNSIGTCTSLTCNDLIQNPSTIVCESYLSSCTYNGSVCVVKQATCNKYVNFTPDACRSTKDTSNKYCWFTSQNLYSGPCQDRTCQDILPSFNQNTCQQHLATCVYNGFSCFDMQDSCSKYINFTQQSCRDVLTTGGMKCWLQSSLPGTCTVRTCQDQVPNPGYQTCLDHNNCAFDGIKCLQFQNTCDLYTNLSFQQCQLIKTQSGTLCWGTQNSGNCIQRLCTHNTTAISDSQCQLFLPSCVTTRPGCISQNSPCSAFASTPESCSQFRGCRGDDSNGNCDIKVCYDNLIATTDQDCIRYSAQCLTNGLGCVNKADSCSFYQGTQDICRKFVGNGRRCWQLLNVPATTPCIEAKCSDNVTATTDSDCQTFLTGCLTKGSGCIASIEPCSSYFGTQNQCNKFIGNGQQCWNTDLASKTDPCVTRTCFQNKFSSSDAECNLFLKGCVSKGQGCTTPQPCSQFQGNLRSCRLFTATDGPCKGKDDTIQSCIPLECSEAPNTYNTDLQCNSFKPGCMTTGAGCDSNVQCSDLVGLNNCGQKSNCQIIGMCDIQHSKCSDYNTPSYCSSNQKCAWHQGFCQDWKCFNAPQNLNTHLACSKLGDDCTTNGNGCMKISQCQYYNEQNACLLAVSSDPAGSCIWTGTRCRSKQCEDAQRSNNTDKLCNLYIIGCLTSGRGCITKPTNCSQYVTKVNCQEDTQGNPCVWRNNKCYQFNNCNDITLKTYSECNTFLNSCTTNGDTCIPKTLCNKYENVYSCVQGTDGPCGWTNDLKCVLFTSCQQSSNITLQSCQSFNNSCVTDGTQCIAMTQCSNYKSQTSCNIGSDGPCTWYLSYCRATICSDLKALTHQQCYNFKAQTQCTTDGVQCIPIPTCALQQQAACVIGTDGPCIWVFLNNSYQCRLQTCTDHVETTTPSCNSLISGCISDGSRCISKALCSTYTTKQACDSGGTDGICAYVGSKCVLMTSCSIANTDQIACSQNKGCSYTRASINGILTNICTDSNCRLASKIINQCNPISNFAQTSYNICIPSTNGCILGDGSSLTQNNCYQMSGNTYTWNPTTLKCQQCNPIKVNDTNTTNITNNTNTTKEVIGNLIILNLILIMNL